MIHGIQKTREWMVMMEEVMQRENEGKVAQDRGVNDYPKNKGSNGEKV